MNAEASKGSSKKSLGKRVVERVFPKVPNFFVLLAEQSAVVGDTAGLLVEYMGSSSPEVAKKTDDVESYVYRTPGGNIDGAGSLAWRASASFSANGQRTRDNNYMLDGVDNNDAYVNRYVVQPPVDSIQEFKIATNAYSAAMFYTVTYVLTTLGTFGLVMMLSASAVDSLQTHGSPYYLFNKQLIFVVGGVLAGSEAMGVPMGVVPADAAVAVVDPARSDAAALLDRLAPTHVLDADGLRSRPGGRPVPPGVGAVVTTACVDVILVCAAEQAV